jgi:NitT/TauT family transport system substrate-binding protein
MFKFVKRALALPVLAALLLAPGAVRAETVIKLAYIPILPMAQLFVMEGEGWTKEAGLKLELTKFSSGPAIVQALAAGNFDMMYVGIGPAMVARAKNIPIKVIAANGIEQIAVIAQGDFNDAFARAASPAEAFANFAAEHGRKVKIASLPKGSVPDTVLRHWLVKVVGIKDTDVEIVGMGADKVQQAMLTRSVDAASILEPVITIVSEKLPDVKVVATGRDMLPGQPGAIVAVRESFLAEHRDAVEKLVALHIRATELIEKDPQRAGRDVYDAIGKGLVAEDTIQAAMRSKQNQFVSDPRTIVEGTKAMHDFQLEIGALKEPVPLDALFDSSIYEAVAK